MSGNHSRATSDIDMIAAWLNRSSGMSLSCALTGDLWFCIGQVLWRCPPRQPWTVGAWQSRRLAWICAADRSTVAAREKAPTTCRPRELERKFGHHRPFVSTTPPTVRIAIALQSRSGLSSQASTQGTLSVSLRFRSVQSPSFPLASAQRLRESPRSDADRQIIAATCASAQIRARHHPRTAVKHPLSFALSQNISNRSGHPSLCSCTSSATLTSLQSQGHSSASAIRSASSPVRPAQQATSGSWKPTSLSEASTLSSCPILVMSSSPRLFQ